MKTAIAFYPDGPNEGGIGAESQAEPICTAVADEYSFSIADDETGVHATFTMSLDDLTKILSTWTGSNVPTEVAVPLRKAMTMLTQ